MIITDYLDRSKPAELSKEEEYMIEEAVKRQPEFDEDCKPLSDELMQRMLQAKRTAV